MPEMGKPAQAIECLVDIRKGEVGSSVILVFDFEQMDGGNEQEKHFIHLSLPKLETPGRTLQGWHKLPANCVNE